MKFTGLILICATSCLALILPAIGVVQFPKTTESLSVASNIESLSGLPVSTQKLGMGVWLMLVPVCLIGLAMWTFAPNPSGAKSRSG